MKKMLFVSACMIAFSTGGAFAQNQPAPGASSEGNVGPGAGGSSHQSATQPKKGATTGMGKMEREPSTMANPSSEGNVGPGTNNNSGKQSGGR
jgi:opacity protein-like surface antigen